MKGERFLNWIDNLNEWIGKGVSWLFLLLIVCIAIDIFMRLIVGRSTEWGFDVNYMIYGTMFMLAGAYTLKHNAHVRVDVLFNMFSTRGRAILENLFYLLIMFPFCLFMFNATWSDFLQAVHSREVSIVSSWHPPIYHYKGIMPLSFALLFLQSLTHFIRNLSKMKR